MKLIITGASGLLGSDLLSFFSNSYEAVGLFGRTDLDISNTEAVIKRLQMEKPDVIFHSAGWRDLDACEEDPSMAYRTNAVGTRNICYAARKIGAKVVYISSDMVFSGQKHSAYNEFDTPAPVNVYGKSKLSAEEQVKNLLDRYYIVRVPLLFGFGSKLRSEENVLVQSYREIKAGKKVRATADQVSSPTFTMDIGEVLSELIRTDYFGLYHVSNKGSSSRVNLLRTGLELLGLPSSEVEEVANAELQRCASRPRFTSLECICLEATLGMKMRTWKEALRACIANDKFKELL